MATTEFRIGALWEWSKSLIGRLTGRNKANTAPVQRTGSGTVAPYSGPGFQIVSFVYRPVSSREKLPLYDQHPLAIQIDQPAGGIVHYYNLHWMPSQVLYRFLQYFKTGRDPARTPVERQELLRAMAQIATDPRLPHRVARSYRVNRISNMYRLTERDLADIDNIMRRFRPMIVPNQNEETIE